MTTSRQFCTFVLNGELFGVDALLVREVIRHQPLTRVPLAPEMIGGLINLRGQLVTAIDLRRRLGMSSAARLGGDSLPMNVVVQTESGMVSLLVDEVKDFLEINEQAREAVPDSVRGLARELVRGVYKLQDGLLLDLDVESAAR